MLRVWSLSFGYLLEYYVKTRLGSSALLLLSQQRQPPPQNGVMLVQKPKTRNMCFPGQVVVWRGPPWS